MFLFGKSSKTQVHLWRFQNDRFYSQGEATVKVFMQKKEEEEKKKKTAKTKVFLIMVVIAVMVLLLEW